MNLPEVHRGALRNRKRISLAVLRFLILLLFAPCCALAAPPDVTAIYPAGGQQGTTLKLTLQGKVEPDKLQLWCSPPGVELVGADGKDAVQVKIATDASPGWRWLAFHSAEGTSAQLAFYVGTLPELLEDEPNNRLSEKTVSLPVVANGVLQRSGDVDVYPFALSAGQTAVASVVARQRIGSPVDCVLQFVDARGFVLVQADDATDFDPLLSFTAPADGFYAVRIFGFPATPDSSIRFAGNANFIYRLTLTAGPVVSRVMPPVVAAGAPARVLAEGWNLPAENGIELPALDAGVQPVECSLGVSTARVWAAPYSTVTLAAEGDGLSEPVALPACIAGRVSSEAGQAFAFVGKKGEKILLRAMAQALGSPLDVVLRVTDAAGKTLQEVDDAVQGDFDAVLEFTPPDDGEYRAAVRDRFAHGGPRFVYALSIAVPEPDVALSVANDSITLTPGKDFELTVNVESRSGFDDEIQLSVEGLPDSCTAEPVKVTPMATGGSGRSGRSGGRRGGGTPSNTAKLVIKTAADAPSWTGELRVAGRTLNQAPVERVAVGKPAGADVSRPRLFAVVAAKP